MARYRTAAEVLTYWKRSSRSADIAAVLREGCLNDTRSPLRGPLGGTRFHPPLVVGKFGHPIEATITPLVAEPTTAATDALLAAASAGGIALLARATPASLLRALWIVALAGWGLSALLGAITHGLDLDPAVEALLWQPLYVGLGVAQALLVVAAVAAWRGEPSAQRLLPFMLVAAAVFYWATWRTGGNFLVFVVFSSATTVFALAVHAALARGRRPGAAWVAVGLAVSLAAGLVQASTLSLDLIWRFDHNGLFHLAQLAGLAILIPGLRRLLA